MKKTYWWRIVILACGVVVYGYSYLSSKAGILGLCHLENEVEKCAIKYNSYIISLHFTSISLVIVSFLLFFVNDNIFKKWMKFFIIWLIASVYFITITPEYRESWMSIGPNRRTISIIMGQLLVFASFAKIVWDSIKGDRKKLKK
ncbi:MAG: hypothetical protein HGB08_02735 [Candidatus Moranbacteria bacterium]|nr:hypothetical protein [Candidatus Moranbacteria bacterium]